MLSFRNVDSWLRMVPSGITTSRPRTVPCSEPYLMSRKPPAFVETLPPMWQLSTESWTDCAKQGGENRSPSLGTEIDRHDVVLRGEVVN